MRLAAEGGLDPAATRLMLDGTEMSAQVREDERAARQMGISGVPTFVFERKRVVSGAQSPGVFADLLERTWTDRTAETGAGDMCDPDRSR